jgi:hypothetical protein
LVRLGLVLVQVDPEKEFQFFGGDGVGLIADSMRFTDWDDKHTLSLF